MITIKSIEFLNPQRVEELWVYLDPMLKASCDGNEISSGSLTPKDIHDLAVDGQCGIFVYFENDIPTCTLVIQFIIEGNKKGVEILALGGKHLTSFKNAYWKSILDWFAVNKVKFVDAHVAPEWANVYLKRYGFQKSCSLVRMSLEEKENG
jgi:hypothetical protein